MSQQPLGFPSFNSWFHVANLCRRATTGETRGCIWPWIVSVYAESITEWLTWRYLRSKWLLLFTKKFISTLSTFQRTTRDLNWNFLSACWYNTVWPHLLTCLSFPCQCLHWRWAMFFWVEWAHIIGRCIYRNTYMHLPVMKVFNTEPKHNTSDCI